MAKIMDMKAQLRARGEGRLILTQALQRSLEILQLPQIELGALIGEEIEKNPLLELESNSASESYAPEICAKPSLYDHLMGQIREAFPNEKYEIALALMEQLDERGFLTEPTEHVDILQILQTLDPPGIFARNLQECFLLQLEKNTLAYRLVHEAFDDLMHRRYAVIKQKLGTDELEPVIQRLSLLSTRPAADFSATAEQPIYSDLHIAKVGQTWIVQSIEDALPRFRLKGEYFNLPDLSQEEKETVRDFAASAKWLTRSIERRRKLLLAIGIHVVKKQESYLNGNTAPASIAPADLASLFGVHESTISRAIADKYIAGPNGLISLQSLISTKTNISAKELLQQLISREDKKAPLTDEQLATALQKEGHAIARRTIAKYRTQLQISSASTRKLTKR